MWDRKSIEEIEMFQKKSEKALIIAARKQKSKK